MCWHQGAQLCQGGDGSSLRGGAIEDVLLSEANSRRKITRNSQEKGTYSGSYHKPLDSACLRGGHDLHNLQQIISRIFSAICDSA